MNLLKLLVILFLVTFVHKLSFADNNPYLGKDWERLVKIKEKYPVSLASTYQQASKMQGNPSAQSQNYGAIKEQAYQQLMLFKKDLVLWLRDIDIKLKRRTLSQDRQSLMIQIKDNLNKLVLPMIETHGLSNFHKIMENIATSPQIDIQYKRVGYTSRFLKPEFAQNYKNQKITFYHNLRQHILQDIENIKSQPNNSQQLKNLQVELDFVTKRLNKWTAMPIMANMRPIKIFPLDEIMGVQNIKDLGFSGAGIYIAITEPQEGETSLHVHSAFKDRVTLDSNTFSKVHGTHVTGIIAARAETIADRDGIAPGATIYYMPIRLKGATKLVYQDINTVKSADQANIISDSEASPQNDSSMADIIEKIIAKHIKIINASMVFSIGPKTLYALKEFAHTGGVIVKAAGNSGVTIDHQINFAKYKLDKSKRNQTAIDLGLFNAIMSDEELKRAFLIIGNMNSPTTLAKSSNRAGFTAERFVAAWGTNIPSTVGHYHRSMLSGTSMAAPMVSGAMALMLQAFPDCGAQNLAQNILKSATSIGKNRDFGHGRLNLTRAYELSEETCKKSATIPKAIK